MEYKVKTEKQSGVLYIDDEITCIKDGDNFLNVHLNNESFDLILTKQLEKRTNKIGKYPDGIYYFENKNSHFIAFSGKIGSIKENQFFHTFKDSYTAYTTFEKQNSILFEGKNQAELDKVQPGARKLFLENYFIQITDHRNSTICCNDLASKGKVLWHIDLKEITQSNKSFLHSRIINFEDKLYLVCNGAENRGLFQFDINSGKLNTKFENLNYEIFEDDNFIYTTKFPNILCRLDCRDDSIVEWDVNDLIKENGFDSIHDHRCNARNGLFYVTQSLGDNKAKFSILDLLSRKLLFKYDFQPKNGAIGSISTTNTKVFIQTQDGLLHIFEK